MIDEIASEIPEFSLPGPNGMLLDIQKVSAFMLVMHILNIRLYNPLSYNLFSPLQLDIAAPGRYNLAAYSLLRAVQRTTLITSGQSTTFYQEVAWPVVMLLELQPMSILLILSGQLQLFNGLS